MRTESFERSDSSSPAFLSPTRNPPRDLKSRYTAGAAATSQRSASMGPPPNEAVHQPVPKTGLPTERKVGTRGPRGKVSGDGARCGDGHGDAVAAQPFCFVQSGAGLLHQACPAVRVAGQGGA